MGASYGSIEVVRGRLSAERSDELVDFWTRAGALTEAAARDRLAEVVCVLRNGEGAIAGVNSVYPSEVGIVGGRQFWIYRSYLAPAARDAWRPMAGSAVLALQAGYDPSLPGPIGVCFPIGDDGLRESNPLAEWLYPTSIYAGYVEGHQVRIRYFGGARVVTPQEPFDFPLTLDRAYRTLAFDDQDEVSPQAVIDLWAREGAMPEGEEADRRISEVVAVATHGGSQEPVAVATAYLRHNAQLRMDMWHFRAFVAAEHRASRVGWGLTLFARDRLRQKFISGLDTRASGMLMEIENEGLKQYLDYGYWGHTDFTFIGENERGDHVRVHYFPGAIAPGPPE